MHGQLVFSRVAKVIGETIIFSTHAQQIVQNNLSIHTHTKNEPLPHTVSKINSRSRKKNRRLNISHNSQRVQVTQESTDR